MKKQLWEYIPLWIAGVGCVCFGFILGMVFMGGYQDISCRKAKIEGIQCIADLVQCERKLEAK